MIFGQFVGLFLLRVELKKRSRSTFEFQNKTIKDNQFKFTCIQLNLLQPMSAESSNNQAFEAEMSEDNLEEELVGKNEMTMPSVFAGQNARQQQTTEKKVLQLSKSAASNLKTDIGGGNMVTLESLKYSIIPNVDKFDELDEMDEIKSKLRLNIDWPFDYNLVSENFVNGEQFNDKVESMVNKKKFQKLQEQGFKVTQDGLIITVDPVLGHQTDKHMQMQTDDVSQVLDEEDEYSQLMAQKSQQMSTSQQAAEEQKHQTSQQTARTNLSKLNTENDTHTNKVVTLEGSPEKDSLQITPVKTKYLEQSHAHNSSVSRSFKYQVDQVEEEDDQQSENSEKEQAEDTEQTPVEESKQEKKRSAPQPKRSYNQFFKNAINLDSDSKKNSNNPTDKSESEKLSDTSSSSSIADLDVDASRSNSPSRKPEEKEKDNSENDISGDTPTFIRHGNSSQGSSMSNERRDPIVKMSTFRGLKSRTHMNLNLIEEKDEDSSLLTSVYESSEEQDNTGNNNSKPRKDEKRIVPSRTILPLPKYVSDNNIGQFKRVDGILKPISSETSSLQVNYLGSDPGNLVAKSLKQTSPTQIKRKQLTEGRDTERSKVESISISNKDKTSSDSLMTEESFDDTTPEVQKEKEKVSEKQKKKTSQKQSKQSSSKEALSPKTNESKVMKQSKTLKQTGIVRKATLNKNKNVIPGLQTQNTLSLFDRSKEIYIPKLQRKSTISMNSYEDPAQKVFSAQGTARQTTERIDKSNANEDKGLVNRQATKFERGIPKINRMGTGFAMQNFQHSQSFRKQSVMQKSSTNKVGVASMLRQQTGASVFQGANDPNIHSSMQSSMRRTGTKTNTMLKIDSALLEQLGGADEYQMEQVVMKLVNQRFQAIKTIHEQTYKDAKLFAYQEAIKFLMIKGKNLVKHITKEVHTIVKQFVACKERFQNRARVADFFQKRWMITECLLSQKLPTMEAEFAMEEKNPTKLFDCMVPVLKEHKLKRINELTMGSNVVSDIQATVRARHLEHQIAEMNLPKLQKENWSMKKHIKQLQEELQVFDLYRNVMENGADCVSLLKDFKTVTDKNKRLVKKMESQKEIYENEIKVLKKQLEDNHYHIVKQQYEVIQPMFKEILKRDKLIEELQSKYKQNYVDLKMVYSILRLPRLCNEFYKAERRRMTSEAFQEAEVTSLKYVHQFKRVANDTKAFFDEFADRLHKLQGQMKPTLEANDVPLEASHFMGKDAQLQQQQYLEQFGATEQQLKPVILTRSNSQQSVTSKNKGKSGKNGKKVVKLSKQHINLNSRNVSDKAYLTLEHKATSALIQTRGKDQNFSTVNSSKNQNQLAVTNLSQSVKLKPGFLTSINNKEDLLSVSPTAITTSPILSPNAQNRRSRLTKSAVMPTRKLDRGSNLKVYQDTQTKNQQQAVVEKVVEARRPALLNLNQIQLAEPKSLNQTIFSSQAKDVSMFDQAKQQSKVNKKQSTFSFRYAEELTPKVKFGGSRRESSNMHESPIKEQPVMVSLQPQMNPIVEHHKNSEVDLPAAIPKLNSSFSDKVSQVLSTVPSLHKPQTNRDMNRDMTNSTEFKSTSQFNTIRYDKTEQLRSLDPSKNLLEAFDDQKMRTSYIIQTQNPPSAMTSSGDFPLSYLEQNSKKKLSKH